MVLELDMPSKELCHVATLLATDCLALQGVNQVNYPQRSASYEK